MIADDPNVISVEDDGWWAVVAFVVPWFLIAVAVWTAIFYWGYWKGRR